ncbi:hypothetical protein QES_4122 [Clostridioides difficile CD149]|uniref:Uncharacterized protein n=2 Tax=Clostridioides difficile TaxID=1496 RepID=A0A9X8RLR0_CLODI|nr:hypothetical protein [Clostridioides difficile]OFU32858.1 hypothetical protein HMPREF3076_02745 [Clostridium sp. HMSC19B12]EGT3961183.1 hypothetical protein [Clostridioides difficile]EGT4016832.1 hypothetical protein [Clostridioides difficile]EGT4145662.1 hypothetical protein [Clostridioides difficile]EGT4203285.1 hypothetical protein [Clostridioides difficile]
MAVSAILEDIEIILKKFKACIESENFIISQSENRQDNNDFLKKYNLDKNKQIEMLNCLTKEDFSKSEEHRNHEGRILYFFGKKYELTNIDGLREEVELYIKFYIAEKKRTKEDFTIIISFHPAKYSIKYYM